MRDHILRMQHFWNYAKWRLSLPSTQDLISKQRRLMQCCMQRFTLLEAIMDEQTVNESCFLSPELKHRIEKYKALKVCAAEEGFLHINLPLLDSEYNLIDSQCQYKY